MVGYCIGSFLGVLAGVALNHFLLIIGTALIGLFTLICLIKKVFGEKQLPAVRGDELAVFPFSPMPIMTPTEVIFFKKLQQAMPEYLIFGQVQLSRIIAPDEDETDKSFWLNRISRMSVDYVIVDADYQTTLLAIELDDWTHDNKHRQKADEKKDKALSSAGIAVLRFDSEQMPNVTQLRQEILHIISLTIGY